MVTDESQQWYVQKGSRVQGPYTADEVGRYLLLGRVRNTDRVSRDGELWEPVTQVPELIPEELLDLGSEQGWQRFLNLRSEKDERASESEVDQEQRHEPDTTATQLRDEWSMSAEQESSPFLPWSLLGITLGALAIVLYVNYS